MADNVKKSGKGIEIMPNEGLETPPSGGKKFVDELLDNLEKEQNEEKKEELLFDALQSFVHPDEVKMLSNLEKVNELDEDLKSYFETGGALLSGIYMLKEDKNVSSVSDMIDYFRNDESESVKNYVSALIFIVKNPDSPVSKWFLDKAWDSVRAKGREYAIAGSAVASSLKLKNAPKNELKDPKEKGLFDSIKDNATPYSDEVKLLLFAGAVGAGFWAITRWVKKKFGKDSGESTGKTLRNIGLVAGGAFVVGKVLGSEGVRDQFAGTEIAKSRWYKSLIAFSNLEFGNAAKFAISGAPSTEVLRQHEELAKYFGVESGLLYNISNMKYSEFIDGKASTLFNFGKQAEADSKVRFALKTYYQDKIQLIPNYRTLSVGQIFTLGLEQGIFKRIDRSDLDEENRGVLEEVEVKHAEEQKEMEEAFDNPDGNIDALNDMGLSMIADIERLDKNVEDHWGSYTHILGAALGWDMFSSLEDTDEYGDIEAARARLLSVINIDDAIAKDHKAFAYLSSQVQEFQTFLEKHPDPDKWTENEIQEFQSHKQKMLRLRQQINSSLRYGNEEAYRKIQEDAEKITTDDLMEGVEFAYYTASGALYPVRLELQALYDGNKVAYTLAATQIASIAYENLSKPWEGYGSFVKRSAVGLVKGPTVAIKFPIDVRFAKRAFEYKPKDLLKMFLRGEMSEGELVQRLDDATKYAHLYKKIPGLPRTMKMRADLVDKYALLKSDATKLRGKWLDIFENDLDLTQGDATKERLEEYFEADDIEELRKFHKERNAAGLRSVQDLRKRLDVEEFVDGTFKIKVDGKEVHIAETEEEALKYMDEMEKVAKEKGMEIKKDKLPKSVWRYARPLVAIIGVYETARIYSRLSGAANKEELQTVIAEETSMILAFLIGGVATAKALNKFAGVKHPVVLALFSIMGGLATSLKLDEPIKAMIENFLDKFPNGYEITDESAALLAGVSTLSTAKMLTSSFEQLAGSKLKTSIHKSAYELGAKGVTQIAESGAYQSAKTAASKGVARLGETASVKASKEVMINLGERLSLELEKKFGKKLAQTCGKDAVYALLKKAGWKGAASAIPAFLDGPIPVGDVLSAALLAWTAKDVYDIGELIWEGYKLNEVLPNRLKAEPGLVEIIEPLELKKKYASLMAENPNAAVDMLMDEPNVTFKIKRYVMEENGEKAVVNSQYVLEKGYEILDRKDGEMKSMVIYESPNERVAGINDEDIQAILDMQKQVAEAEIEKEKGSLGG